MVVNFVLSFLFLSVKEKEMISLVQHTFKHLSSKRNNYFMNPKITNTEIAKLIKPRQADSYKGTYGHSLLIAGSKGKMGAALIAAKACLRSGTGLLTVNIPFTERAILQTALPEAMLMSNTAEIEWDKFTVIGIGPAMGTNAGSLLILKEVLGNYKKPLLIDADALTMLSQNKKLWEKIPSGSILTPHIGEFDRMFGKSKTQDERMQKAVEFSEHYNWVIVLKNYETFVAFNGHAVLSTSGNAGLAKGGSGDMLSGMITAFLAQEYEPFTAAKIGVQLHGMAADIAIKKQSMESLLITDVIECMGNAFYKLAAIK
jgi:hydroxyethylthiazole kinase-like uncharacterized protein yjeF